MRIQDLALAACLWTLGLAKMLKQERCDPTLEEQSCPPSPAFAGTTTFEFTSASWDDDFNAFWSVDEDTVNDRRRLDFETSGEGLALGMWDSGQAPTLTSNDYLFFGKVSVEMRAAEGHGLITALVLMSDSGDEIDWEILGAFDNQAETNYFHNGVPLYNVYNTTYNTTSSVFSEFHTYTVEWSPTQLTFSIDGTPRKTWSNATVDNEGAEGIIPLEKWPQKPMRVKLGAWAVNQDSDDGTVVWAGGLPTWDSGPFRFCENKISDKAVEYVLDERMKKWEDVQVSGCEKRDVDTSSTAYALATSTKGDYPLPPGASASASSGTAGATYATTTTSTSGSVQGASGTETSGVPAQETEGKEGMAVPTGRGLSVMSVSLALVACALMV